MRPQRRLCLPVGDRIGDVQPLAGGIDRFVHQRLIILAQQPGGALAVAIALAHRLGEQCPAGGTQGFQRRPARDERPAQTARLRIGKGDEAGLAHRLVRLVAGEDVPDVVHVAGAPAHPGIGVVDVGFGRVEAAHLDQPVGRIAGGLEELAIGGADGAGRERCHPGAVGKTLRQFDPFIGDPPAVAAGDQPRIAMRRIPDVERAHDAKDLRRVVAIGQQLAQRIERRPPGTLAGGAGEGRKLGQCGDSLLTMVSVYTGIPRLTRAAGIGIASRAGC